TVRAEGFYDGDGRYVVRFMPSFEGSYTFRVTASFLDAPVSGEFTVSPASAGNHGPVRVHNTYHFCYEDGTPYYSIGTTCYVWALQDDARIAQTLDTLRHSAFNKIRFCLLPKHYDYNLGEPRSYPYEGTPMDSSVLTSDNFNDYTGKTKGNHWDFTRFNPEHFRHLESCVLALQKMGIEADLIVMHPYDRWGFSCMTREQDDLYWRYVLARFSAYRNVWWSLANEYDIMRAKTVEDWEHYAALICALDPYRHLRSIHQCIHPYDHSRPWITHCSIQRVDLYKTAEVTDELRERYRKPVVLDEIAYEGDIQHGWGNISGEEMLRRFWEAACRGGYPGHGETYLCPENVLWWSHGGVLRGESHKRFGLLRRIMEQTPGVGLRPYPLSWDCTCAVPQEDGHGLYFLIYFSFMRPSFREFHFDDDTPLRVEVIDTWEGTVRDAGVHKGKFRVELPGKPYMALRIRQEGSSSK
ncbi:MAG: DUF5605 domain-containing protein, partial [Candidatus Spyradocola sp.]